MFYNIWNNQTTKLQTSSFTDRRLVSPYISKMFSHAWKCYVLQPIKSGVKIKDIQHQTHLRLKLNIKVTYSLIVQILHLKLIKNSCDIHPITTEFIKTLNLSWILSVHLIYKIQLSMQQQDTSLCMTKFYAHMSGSSSHEFLSTILFSTTSHHSFENRAVFLLM